MAYSVSDLQSYFYNMFTIQANPNTMAQHYKDFSKVYDDYCKDAKESVANNVIVTTGKTIFETTFLPYSLVPVPSLTIYATFIETACIAYWGGCSFALTNKPSGWSQVLNIAITPMGQDSMKGTLETAFLVSNGDPTILSTAMATIIHGATGSVSIQLNGLDTTGKNVSLTGSLSP